MIISLYGVKVTNANKIVKLWGKELLRIIPLPD
jgi:hypothetical protein